MQDNRYFQLNTAPPRDFSLIDIVPGTALMMGVILLNAAGVAGNLVFFAIVALMLIGSPRWAFEGLVMGFLALCTNHSFVVKTIVWSVARFGLVVVPPIRFACDLAAMKRSVFSFPFYLWLCVFCLVVSVTTCLSGNRIDLGLLKLLSFWLGSSGLILGATVLRNAGIDVAPWIMKSIACSSGFCVLSLIAGVGQNFRDPRFVQGLYNLGFYHSQTLGPLSALMLLYVVCVYLFSAYRNRWICLGLMVPLIGNLLLSGSRTGLVTLVGGLSVVGLTAFAWRATPRFRLRLNVSRASLLFGGVTVVMAALAVDAVTGGRVTRGLTSFVLKGYDEEKAITVEGVTASRRELIDRSMESFWKSPLVGNGFQLYASREWADNVTIFSSQIEKGFLPTAILEETGVIGTAFLLLFLGSYISYCVRERNIPGITLFVGLLFMNLGEAVFFAMAGHGALAWTLAIGGLLLGDSCRVNAISVIHSGRSASGVWITDGRSKPAQPAA